MIGNDIVDLKQAARDSPDSYRDGQRYQRFLNKVFTTKEQQFLFTSENQHQMVWLLWSMKEAAYKVDVQQFGKQFFNPKRIVCKLLSLEKGMVKIDNEIYFTTSKITEEYIYSVASLTTKSNYKSQCFKVENSDYKTQSETLKYRLKKSLKIDSSQIRKNSIGIPKLFQNNHELDKLFSLTHHGSHCAYVIQ